MNDFTLYAFFALVIGLVLGFLIGKMSASNSGNSISKEDVAKDYVLKALKVQSDDNLMLTKKELEIKNQNYVLLNKDIAALEQMNINLEEKLNAQKAEVETLQKKFQTEFQNVANAILEEKSQRFTSQNTVNMEALLAPLREKITLFEANIDKKFTEDLKERVSIKTEIELLRTLNTQLSTDAHNLSTALRGDSKVQGDWGEMHLEMLLEKAGLQRNIHFDMQTDFLDTDGQHKRPDCVIRLPGEKCLVIDSKVSLTHFSKHITEPDALKKEQFLKQHVESVKAHIKNLESKNYAQLNQISTLDYVILFMPLENAFSMAQQADPKIFSDALDKNILIVTPTTLLATMRTVSFIWSQEKQNKNVLEIAKQSGLLYDKFVGFIADLKDIGAKLDAAQGSYHAALNKLNDSKKFGDTLIGRVELIKKLGAKATKSLPTDMLNDDISIFSESREQLDA